MTEYNTGRRNRFGDGTAADANAAADADAAATAESLKVELDAAFRFLWRTKRHWLSNAKERVFWNSGRTGAVQGKPSQN